MDINAINHAKTMYVTLHGLCGFISIFGILILIILFFIILLLLDSFFDEYFLRQKIQKTYLKWAINFFVIFTIVFSLVVLSFAVPSYYKSQLVVSGMSYEQISKLVGK